MMNDIVHDALLLLDENLSLIEARIEPLSEDADIRSQIRGVAPDAALKAATEAELSEFEEFSVAVIKPTSQSGRLLVPLPLDCLRPVSVIMNGWPYGADRMMNPQDAALSLRRFRARQGGFRRQSPAMALIVQDGVRYLELFGPDSSSGRLSYVPRPVADAAAIEIDAGLKPRLLDNIVKKIKEITGSDYI